MDEHGFDECGCDESSRIAVSLYALGLCLVSDLMTGGAFQYQFKEAMLKGNPNARRAVVVLKRKQNLWLDLTAICMKTAVRV
jgi:hypothetical protein